MVYCCLIETFVCSSLTFFVELGQAIQRVARAHGEKGPGSEEPAVETESWTRFSRFRRKLASKSPTDVSSGTASGGCPLSNNTSSHSTGMGQGARRKLAKLKAAASGGSGSNGSGSSGKMHKSKDQADDGATELRDEAFFVTPFLLPPPPTRASASI